MKNIIDVYNIEESNFTPLNTSGMGNPMPATDTQVGSEPIIPTAKTKTEKKQKKQNVKEGILDNIDTTIAGGDKLISIIEWYKSQMKEARVYFNDSEINSLMKQLSIENDTLIINCGDRNALCNDLYINELPPCGIKNIKVYNAKTEFGIFSFTSDLSKLNFEIYSDNGKIYGDVKVRVKIRAGKDISLGNITCDNFTVDSHTIESITVGKNSIILELNLSTCKKLEFIYNIAMHQIQRAFLPEHFIVYQLKSAGLLSWSTNVYIK